ncbi:MAG: hypothetical protein GTN78_24070, partial [Gemmatimonadales bacterium]|nr:hypothetical protein [Gemmatimonadales bacterium]NIN11950.1 hypothetical protein [Gemmatimonadales bacterium]NIR03239.1 hypothetical protein [Gemmatimonadales bacterium]NIS66925.1 hypothetical protein [Gemmatimonadales bacterium]
MTGGRTGGRAVRRPVAIAMAFCLGAAQLLAQDTTRARVRELNDRISIRFVEADIRAVIQALGRYLDKPVVTGDIPATQVTLETPSPIPRGQVRGLLRGLVEAHNLGFAEDSALIRISRPAAGRAGRQAAAQEAPPLRLFVIRLKHARAADVAATVNLLFGGQGAFAATAGLSTGTLSDELRRDAEGVLRQGERGQEGQRGQRESTAELTGPVTIVPDELTNSLLVRASEEDFQVLAEAVQQLDLRPLQVLIEVLIVEVRRDRLFSLGADASVEDVDIGAGGTLSGFLFGGGLGTFVLQVMSLGKYDIDATLRAAVARGDARIISRPVVVASNNRE